MHYTTRMKRGFSAYRCRNQKDQSQHAFDSGCEAYIQTPSKPFLERTLVRLLPGEQRLAALASQAIKDQKTKARRERARQVRGRFAQTKAWLVALKTHVAYDWATRLLERIEASKESPPIASKFPKYPGGASYRATTHELLDEGF